MSRSPVVGGGGGEGTSPFLLLSDIEPTFRVGHGAIEMISGTYVCHAVLLWDGPLFRLYLFSLEYLEDTLCLNRLYSMQLFFVVPSTLSLEILFIFKFFPID